VVGGIVGLIVIGAVASILTFNLLRRGGGVTVTPAVSGSLPALVTETPSPEPTPTIVPTDTAAPDVVLPTASPHALADEYDETMMSLRGAVRRRSNPTRG
jgi:hypothetical protein